MCIRDRYLIIVHCGLWMCFSAAKKWYIHCLSSVSRCQLINIRTISPVLLPLPLLCQWCLNVTEECYCVKEHTTSSSPSSTVPAKNLHVYYSPVKRCNGQAWHAGWSIIKCPYQGCRKFDTLLPACQNIWKNMTSNLSAGLYKLPPTVLKWNVPSDTQLPKRHPNDSCSQKGRR